MNVSAPYGKFTLRAGMRMNEKDLVIGKTDGTTKAKTTSIGGEYALSKRTELQYQRMNTKNGVVKSATAANNYGWDVIGGGFGDSTGSAYFIGMQHKF